MNIFDDVFKKELIIDQVNKPDQKVDRTLASKYILLNSLSEKKDMKTAINDLKKYIENKK